MKYLILVFVLLLSACNTTETINELHAKALVVNTILNEGHEVDDIIITPLSDAEAYRVLQAFDVYYTFNDKWIKSISLGDISSESFYKEYSNLRTEYLVVYGIVKLNWDSYDSLTQSKLILIHGQFESVDRAIGQAFTLNDRKLMYFEAAKAASLLIKIFIKV